MNKKYKIIACFFIIALAGFVFVTNMTHNVIKDEGIPLGAVDSVNVKDFGALGDGVVDDTKSIQDAVDYAYNNKIKRVIIPEGHYMVSLNVPKSGRYTAISLYSNMKIEMQTGTVVEAKPTKENSYAIFNIIDCDSVLIDGGLIVGERNGHFGTSGEHGMGINIFKSRDITISNVTIKNCWGDGIYIGGLNSSQINKNILVTNANISNCRRQGISVTTGEGITIKDSTIYNINGTAPQSGIDIETNWDDTPVKNINIVGNTFYDNVAKDIVFGGESENILISNNTFAKNTLDVHQAAIILVYGDNVTITNNKISDRSGGISCRNNEKVEIINNSFYGYSENGIYQGVGISLCDNALNVNIHNNTMSTLTKGITVSGKIGNVKKISIHDNIIENIQTDGFFGYQMVDELILKNNTFRNVIERYGIVLRGDNLEITGNLVENCGDNSMMLFTGDKIKISKNIFVEKSKDNVDSFIYVYADVKNCTIISNSFESETQDKKVVSTSKYSKSTYPLTIADNTFEYTKNPYDNNLQIIKNYSIRN